MKAATSTTNTEKKAFAKEYQMIPANQIRTDTRYQREVHDTEIRNLIRDFDPNVVNVVKVSERDGAFYVIDGQHTVLMMKQKFFNDVPIHCMVYHGLTWQDEAELFEKQNGRVKKITPNEIFHSKLMRGEETAVAINDVVKAVRLTISKKLTACTRGNIACVSAIEHVYAAYGAKVLYDTLDTILQAWGDEAKAKSGNMVRGIAYVLHTYAGEINKKKLISNLATVSPNTIIREASLYTSTKEKAYATVIVQIYNKRATRKLEEKA